MKHKFKHLLRHVMIYFFGLPLFIAAPLWLTTTRSIALFAAGVVMGIGLGFLIEGIRKNANK